MPSVDATPIMVDDQLSNAGAYINNAAATIVDQLTALMQQLQPLLDSWTGPAATYYTGLQSEWNYAANGLFGGAGQDGVLGEIAAVMNVAWGNYSDAEWANVSTWQPSA